MVKAMPMGARSFMGSKGSRCRLGRMVSAALAAHIARALSLPMEPVDERWSTVAASRALREAGHDSRAQRGVIDQAAATVMLQSWLDVHGRAPASP